MSYSRWNKECDIYCFPCNEPTVIECCGCILNEDDYQLFKTPEEFMEHLKLHIKAGHKVPEHLFNRDIYNDYFGVKK